MPRRIVPVFPDDKTVRRIYASPEIKKVINKTAKRFATKRLEFREELQSDGWVGAFNTTKSTEDVSLIADRARKAIQAAYKTEYRQRVKSRKIEAIICETDEEDLPLWLRPRQL